MHEPGAATYAMLVNGAFTGAFYAAVTSTKGAQMRRRMTLLLGAVLAVLAMLALVVARRSSRPAFGNVARAGPWDGLA